MLRALLAGGSRAGAEELAPIAYRRRDLVKRPSLPRSLQAEVFLADRFQCRYCGGKVILTSIMELLGGIYPNDFPFHRNWKGGQTHPAILSRSAIIDHVKPGGGPEGADWLARVNLVTACWPCNARKGDLPVDLLGWKLLPTAKNDWDGLTRFYRRLWDLAGQPNPRLHGSWMRALGI